MTMTAEVEDFGPAVVEAVDVHHHYGEGPQRADVLFDINMQVREGELVIVTGPSGSGKTTLLTILGTMRRPSEGKLRLLGTDIVGATLAYGLYDVSGGPSQRLDAGALAVFNDAQKLVYPDLTIEQRRVPSISPLYADLTALPPALGERTGTPVRCWGAAAALLRGVLHVQVLVEPGHGLGPDVVDLAERHVACALVAHDLRVHALRLQGVRRRVRPVGRHDDVRRAGEQQARRVVRRRQIRSAARRDAARDRDPGLHP